MNSNESDSHYHQHREFGQTLDEERIDRDTTIIDWIHVEVRVEDIEEKWVVSYEMNWLPFEVEYSVFYDNQQSLNIHYEERVKWCFHYESYQYA